MTTGLLEELTRKRALCELQAVDPDDAQTWQIGRAEIGPYRVMTSYSPIRFAPAYGMPGAPHHFETLVVHDVGDGHAYVTSQTYRTEAEAVDGHAAMVAQYRTKAEAA